MSRPRINTLMVAVALVLAAIAGGLCSTWICTRCEATCMSSPAASEAPATPTAPAALATDENESAGIFGIDVDSHRLDFVRGVS